MAEKIYLVHPDGALSALHEASYANEDKFQALLEQYPNLLAGEQMNERDPRRWVLVSREMGVPDGEYEANRWAVDHLFLDQDGIPTLVEVKRSQDTRIRREVVGQMLDYAANAMLYWPVESIRARFEERCRSQGREPAQEIAALLGVAADDDFHIEEYWQNVKTNLQAGKIRLVFVADEIPSELRRIVEFLNAQMDPAEVLAVEIKRYAGQDVQMLVPKVIGKTPAGERKKGRAVSARRWDETTFFAALQSQRGEKEVQVARALLSWAKRNMPSIWWGQGARDGGFIPGLEHKGKWHQLIEVWTYGKVELQFQYMKHYPFSQPEKRLEFLRRCNQIDGVHIPEDAIERRPAISLAALVQEGALQQFLAVLEWAVQEILQT